MGDRKANQFAQGLKRFLPEKTVARLQAVDHWIHGEPELRLMKRLCSSRKSTVDVGANIGTYCHFMRRHSRDVTAYEPNPVLASRLARLYPDIRVRNVAVSDRAGKVVLRMPVDGDNQLHELASISQKFDDADQLVQFDVEAVKLDEESLTELGFLKIDAEQHEKEALLGALGAIQRWRPIIMTETTPLLYPAGLPGHFRFLTELDYVGWFTFKGQAHSFDAFDPATHANAALFGTRDFMNPNVFFFPREAPGDPILNR